MADIDKLQIEIEASSTDAAKEVTRLADAMKNLKSATATQFNNPIKEIQKSASSPVKADKISKELEKVDKEIEKTSKKLIELQDKYDTYSDLSAGVGEKISGSMAEDIKSQLNDLSKVYDALDAQRRSLVESLNAKPVINLEPQDSKTMSQAEQRAEELIAEIEDLDNRLKEVGITGDKAFRDMTSSEILAMSQAQLLDVRIESIKQKLDKAAFSGKVSAGEIAKLAEQVHRLEAQKAKLTIDSSDVTKAEKRVNRLTKLLESIKRIAFYRAIRSGIKSIAESVTTGVKNLYEWSNIVGGRFKPAMDSIATSALYAKNALGAMVGPIIETLAPAIEWLTDKFVALINVIGQLFAVLGGKTSYTKAVKQATEYSKATDKAAASAKKFLLGIDELNVIDKSAGAGGASVQDYASMFEPETITDEMAKRMKALADWIVVIGSAIAAWKLSDTFLGGLKTTAGLIMAIKGAIEFAKAVWDMWQNGVDKGNLTKALLSLTVLAGGLALAFGKVWAGVSLVVGGIALFVVSTKDAFDNGMNLYNMLGMVAGILATGLGLAIITGSFIPLLIAGFAAAGLAIAYFTGHGEELIAGLKDIFGGFKDFIVHIFNGDMEAAAEDLKRIWEGLKTVAAAIWEGIKDLFKAAWESIKSWWNKNAAQYFTGKYWNDLGKSIINNFLDGLKSAWASVTSWVSSAVSSIKSKLSLSLSSTNVSTAKNMTTITAHASGGFPTTGQLFLAREAGPELVGNIGGQTAVANNEQIVAGISQGVANANSEQNALLRQQNELLSAILAKTGISIDGKTLMTSVERAQRQRGANIMAGGVFA